MSYHRVDQDGIARLRSNTNMLDPCARGELGSVSRSAGRPEGVRRCRCRAADVAAAPVASLLIKKSLCAVGTFSLPAPLLMPME